MKISGRNKLTGTITNVIPGTVTAEVEVEVRGENRVVGVITKKSLDELQLKKGEEVTALIKATSVMFITD